MKTRWLTIILLLLLIPAFQSCSKKSSEQENDKNKAFYTEIIPYPEDFLTMHRINASEDNDRETPFIYASGQDANGEFRIAYYNDYEAYEYLSVSGELSTVQTVYKSADYVTSEGVSIGSPKNDVLAAYQKYDLNEYKITEITSMGLKSLDMVISGVSLADSFLYIDNHNIFNDSYPDYDYWGGLGAFIFILDQNNTVVKIVSYAPTSG